MTTYAPTGRGMRGGIASPRRSSRGRRYRSGSGSRRQLLWDGNIFGVSTITPGGVTEMVLATETEIEARSEKPTIARIYGELLLWALGSSGQTVRGAWGIRLVEADATVTTTAFSPLLDSDSSDWITWRAFTFWVPPTVATYDSDLQMQRIVLDIRNPRKAQPDQELLLIIQTTSSSDGNLLASHWNRVGYLLT